MSTLALLCRHRSSTLPSLLLSRTPHRPFIVPSLCIMPKKPFSTASREQSPDSSDSRQNSSSNDKGSNPANNSSRTKFWVMGILAAGLAYTLSSKTYNYNSWLSANPVTSDRKPSTNKNQPPVGELSSSQKSMLAEINEKLRANEKVYSAGVGRVLSYHVNKVSSNDPMEDRNSQHVWGDKLIFGMFDGHGGYHCSTVLSHYLANYIAGKLLSSESSHSPDSQDPAVTKALRDAFTEMDRDLLAVPEKIIEFQDKLDHLTPETIRDLLLPGIDGAVAVVSYIDGPHLYVANTGDCRAVLGRFKPDGSYEAVNLSTDHTAENPSELKRVMSEHPGEENTVVMRGRILGGLMPFRAFGDAKYKWSIPTLEKISNTFFADSNYRRRWIPKNYKSPPYVTAEPEITYHKLTTQDQFVVLATDGLWENLNSQDVVTLVGEYIKRHPEVLNSTDGEAALNLKVQKTKDETEVSDGKWVYLDDNVSTHLIRNAFGGPNPAFKTQSPKSKQLNGKQIEYVHHLLNIPAPYSRQYRDDVTVTVIFFDTSSPQDKSEKKEGRKEGLTHVDFRKSRIGLFGVGGIGVENKDVVKPKL
ncbi:phosphatase 2C-like domain-containing protein [Paraphysoderma sedebokerense]|nr:phosphatase 2C-like domain-containing protein [Paraphysoderma sedebokerense]